MSSLVLSRRDLDFLLYDWLQVTKLCERPRYAEHSRETLDAALDVAEAVATTYFAPFNKKGDQQEPRYENGRVETVPELAVALKEFASSGFLAADKDQQFGGMQLPVVVERACFAWFLGANYGFACYPLLTRANAGLLLHYGNAEQIESYVYPMLDGRFSGTMCLSEPGAGSALTEVRTRAEPQSDGSYRLFGSKMWVSGGEHEATENIIHLVLARIPGSPPGVKGLSLFLVPRLLLTEKGTSSQRNDIALAGLNHKMGTRSAVNCLLNFGEGRFRPAGAVGAKGWLVGAVNQGLACMFMMMNEARIAVGLSATALGYTAYLHSLDYSRTRLQGRLPSNKNPLSPPVSIISHSDVRRMLLAQKCYAEGALALILYCARLVDDERTLENPARHDATLLLDILTPVAKSWPSQWCLKGCDLAIQVHGGYGYTRDYNVEQFYRDNRLNLIHEGTHGIHGLDLLGRKVSMAEGRAFQLLVDRIDDSISRCKQLTGLAGLAQQLEERVRRIKAVTRTHVAMADRDRALANASAYLEVLGHIIVAWLWLDQSPALMAGDGGFYEGKRQVVQYFFGWELPSVDPVIERLEAADTTVFAMQEAWF